MLEVPAHTTPGVPPLPRAMTPSHTGLMNIPSEDIQISPRGSNGAAALDPAKQWQKPKSLPSLSAAWIEGMRGAIRNTQGTGTDKDG